jgi:hypothetical protein
MSARPKTCGSCTLCCKLLAVEELAKPMGQWCVHLRSGCGIYGTRPQACRTFECVWLMDPQMPHRFRPDQTRVVLDQDPEGTRLIARCDPANPGAWRRNPMYAALKAYAAETWGAGKLVLAVAGRRTWVVTPKEDVDLGEIEPGVGLRVVERAGGMVDVEVLPLLA